MKNPNGPSIEEKDAWADALTDLALAQSVPAPAAPDPAGWRQAPPDAQGWWWWWNGDEDSTPAPVSIMYSGTDGGYFAASGQLGWTESQGVVDMGGWWLRLLEPTQPNTSAVIPPQPTEKPLKAVKAWECEFCGHVTPRTESGARQHEEMCRWEKAGQAVWVENGKVCHAPKVPPKLFGPHDYGNDDGTRDCSHGCGCWAGACASGGPVAPFGPCPRNPKATAGDGVAQHAEPRPPTCGRRARSKHDAGTIHICGKPLGHAGQHEDATTWFRWGRRNRPGELRPPLS